MVDHYQLNLGSLRSSITLTLHTHHAARLWQGRAAREGVHGILGMAGYISVTNLLKQASSQDDPFADWFMLQLEDKLLQAKADLQTLTEQASLVERDLPTQVDIGDNLNIHPRRPGGQQRPRKGGGRQVRLTPARRPRGHAPLPVRPAHSAPSDEPQPGHSAHVGRR